MSAIRFLTRATVLSAALASLLVATPAGAIVHVRRNVYDPTAPVSVYASGVRAMKARPATDPTSWAYQAAIHGTYASPPLPLWNQCQHGSFFFLSWHRMYLYYFERIVRKAACGSDAPCRDRFALPYWNYSDSSPERVMPPAFRTPAKKSNPLWVSERRPAINAGSPLPESAVSYAVAFAYRNFVSPTGSPFGFGGQRLLAPAHFDGPHGQLEQQPHDVVHGAIGGFGGWMSDPNTAAQDPIFWLHHANIDRLWKRWLDLGDGRSDPDPSTDALWYAHKFHFFDEEGREVTLTGAQVVETVTQLDYRYDDDPPVLPLLATAKPGAPPTPRPGPPEVLSEAPIEGRTRLGAEPVRVLVKVKEEARGRVRSAVAGAGAEGRLVLEIEGIEFDRYPDPYYEVYVNLAAGEEPDFRSPSYAGNLAFFGLKGHGGHGEGTTDARGVVRSFDLSGVSAALMKAGRWDDAALTVTLVPQGPRAKGAKRPKFASGTLAWFARIMLTLQ